MEKQGSVLSIKNRAQRKSIEVKVEKGGDVL